MNAIDPNQVDTMYYYQTNDASKINRAGIVIIVIYLFIYWNAGARHTGDDHAFICESDCIVGALTNITTIPN
jgi:hypothetical protein